VDLTLPGPIAIFDSFFPANNERWSWAIFVSSPYKTHGQVTILAKATFLSVTSFSALLVLGSDNFD
jgi:hypothetical protein